MKIEIPMKANGKRERGMEKESISGQMGRLMKVSGRTVLLMEFGSMMKLLFDLTYITIFKH